MGIPSESLTELRVFLALVIGLAGQIAGRLVDLRWHLTHDEFEGAAEQLQAHWLIWLATICVLGTAGIAVKEVNQRGQRRGFLIVLGANLAYAVLAVIHFFQHLNHLEVDWAHLLLAITSIAAAVGASWVIAARFASRRAAKRVVA